MLKYLFPAIDWAEIKTVGFDLDGTLYDEFDFISQVYQPISREIAAKIGGCERNVYTQLLHRWLEKGSSYNKIFFEKLSGTGLNPKEVESTVDRCLNIFRNFKPILTLSQRSFEILEFTATRFELFLVSDGGCELQNAKFKALALERWFARGNVAISGCLGNEGKPNVSILENLAVFQEAQREPGSVAYFGDREIDRKFSEAAGFQFVAVANMFNVNHLPIVSHSKGL
jgi:putative hydrolase of the HAD superfamily